MHNSVMLAPLMHARLLRGSPLLTLLQRRTPCTKHFSHCRGQQCPFRVSCTSTAASVTSIAQHNPNVVFEAPGRST